MDTGAADVETGRSKQGQKPSGSGSRRSVTKLSAEQLIRKRAADREAQRAIRQRTREHIQSLEQRIKELSGNDTANEPSLEELERKNAELEEEIRRLKTTLEGLQSRHIVKSAELRTSNHGAGVVMALTTPIEDIAHPSPSIPFRTSNSRLDHQPISRNAEQAVATSTPTPRQPTGLIMRSPSATLMSSQTKRLASNLEFPGLEHHGPDRTYHIPTSFVKQPSIHVWEAPLCYKAPETPIDKILYGIIQNQRQLAKEGLTATLAEGPRSPSLNMLVAPEKFESSQVHAVARIVGEMLSKITYRSFIDKLAAFIVIYPMYQWQISHTYESYKNIPSWCMPVLCQRTMPHPVWICALGYPGLREIVIANQEKYCTEEFQYLLIASLNVNWPHGIQEALLWNGKDIKFLQEFWDHARVMDNWTIDKPFQLRYPELKPYCKFTEYPEYKGQR